MIFSYKNSIIIIFFNCFYRSCTIAIKLLRTAGSTLMAWSCFHSWKQALQSICQFRTEDGIEK